MEALTQPPHLLCPIAHPEDVGAARRRVSRAGTDAGVDAKLLANAELVTSELATNLLRHAEPGGAILARAIATDAGPGIEVLAVDRGPGIADLDAALGGQAPDPAGLGCGLAAVRRLAGDVDVYTQQDVGTVVMARFVPRGAASAAARWSGISVALDGGEDCGDAWAITETGDRTTVLVVDGLGHGRRAAEAARVAVRVFAERHDDELESLAQRLHEAMRTTRGGAAALCRLDPQRHRAEFVGVGNVVGRLVGPSGSQAMVSNNGTLGTELAAPRIRRMSYELDRAALVMSTDGIREGYDLTEHPGLLDHDPLVVAAMVYAQRGRGTDDATVVVVRPQRVAVAA
jgi:anti-sigma regulatory factor (Ser/Thr protein kinase)/serine/threonine protein phosphatase PrpC